MISDTQSEIVGLVAKAIVLRAIGYLLFYRLGFVFDKQELVHGFQLPAVGDLVFEKKLRVERTQVMIAGKQQVECSWFYTRVDHSIAIAGKHAGSLATDCKTDHIDIETRIPFWRNLIAQVGSNIH
jgi:hypothetical protein